MLLRSVLCLFALPIALSWTIIEDIYLTKDMVNYFEEELLDDDDGGASKSDENSRETLDSLRIATLLSTLDTTGRADHYWTRLGHRRRTSTITPVNSWDYYISQQPWYNYYNSIASRRRKRESEREGESAPKNDVEMLAASDQNKTTEAPKPVLDFRLRRGFRKCCPDAEESQPTNETLQTLKSECHREVRKNRQSLNSSDFFEGDGGLYNMFSCERILRWKATVACTIDCLGQKLSMVDAEGAIDVNAAKIIVRENFAQQKWQQSVSDDLVDKCAKEVSDNPKSPLERYGLKCNTTMAQFAYCMWREFFMACPMDRQRRNRPCDRLRNALRRHNENKFGKFGYQEE